ncbi:MAG: acetyl-CoA carboxylase, carboxyltransferase subunit beta [Alphaproteobacteria bacterium]|jgi:acetyl-CoA carboxylase carboxyl transferase subunit beta|nr:acetyl-CoA carboxylase carboxyltransferase subunit beta [Rhodospirillaceae bacterium]MBT6205321.1 acetyl-CoA carboxylase carboxyltransferase subunit beta [Rhodospirillaceae bacterium]MBT7612707.1 acetyl-CoA carboxylase carboxyltransferase subunit beta [Rhodospirillaceae bacterium]MBT7648460.1 acetyl-CoA carboxylase carboxyltransferase subunit beta [Rhodospirillaceae bacterium]MDG2481599.1 acetyl-CoA carboxylase, carboxyltransferase subunit beta [Alphaproteobacteria bacterium]
MSWLSDLGLPKIRDLVRKTQTQENLWDKCPSCEQMIFHRDLEAAMNICTHCGFHMRIAPAVRLRALFDDSAFTVIELPAVAVDPLRFRDRKRYADRLKDAQSKTGEREAIVVAHGTIGSRPVVCAVFNFDFMGGSMGTGVGEAIVAAARLAKLQGGALIVFSASGGARMQEGILSLMQMARTTAAIAELKEAGLPYISVMTNPTTGGVTASFAMLGDVSVAEPGAIIGFAGARVIEETIREKLPEGFQRAEYLLEHGMLDMVVSRTELRDRLAAILNHLMSARPQQGELLPVPANDADQAAPA